jgi:hypothetical protein
MFVPPRYSEEKARVAIAESTSWSEALRKLGMRPAGRNWKTLERYAGEVWGIPTDHFDHRPRQTTRHYARPLGEILVEHSTYDRGSLKRRLYAEEIKLRRCELCGQGEEWRGRRMSLILDHINGVATDNRLENLQIVCPNCAATLETHAVGTFRARWWNSTARAAESRSCAGGPGRGTAHASAVPATPGHLVHSRTPQSRAATLRAARAGDCGDELRGRRAEVRGLGQCDPQVAAGVRARARRGVAVTAGRSGADRMGGRIRE